MINQSEFGVRINTSADLAALKATKAGLEEAKAAAERMGLSTKGAEEEIAALERQISHLGSEARKSGEEAGKLEVSHRELKIAAHELAGQAGLGEVAGVLHGMFSPEAAGLFAFITALDLAQKSLDAFADKVVDALAKMRELNEALSTAHREAVAEAHAAQTAFADSLAVTARNEDAATQAADRAIAILKGQSKQTESLVDLEIKLAEALIAQKEARGQITKTQADQQTQAIEHQAQIQKDRADDKAAAGEIAARRGQLAGVIGERDTATGKLPAARQDAARLAEDAKDAQAGIAPLEETLKTAKEAEDAATKTLAKWAALLAVGAPGAQTGFDQATDALGLATEGRKQAQNRLETAQNIASLAQEEADRRKKLVTALEEEAKARTELADQLRQQIHDMAADNARRIAERTQRETVSQHIQDVQNQTALETRIRDGSASAAEIAQFHASQERGPQAALDASEAVRNVRGFMQTVRGHTLSQSERSQLDLFAGEVSGFLHDLFADLGSQRSGLEQAQRDLQTLRTSTRFSNGPFQ